MSAMLEVKNIHCAYDAVPVIRGISLEVNEGELVAIIGANGAGKSTTEDDRRTYASGQRYDKLYGGGYFKDFGLKNDQEGAELCS